MQKHETVSEIPRASAGQIRQLAAFLTQMVPLDMPADMAQGWIGNNDSLEPAVREILLAEKPTATSSRALSLAQWKSKFRGWPCGGCHKPLLGAIGFHPSKTGVEIKGFSKRQRIFALCPCGKETEPDFGVAYRETEETFNPEFVVVRRAFREVVPLLEAVDPHGPAWFDEVKKLLEPFRREFESPAFVSDAGTVAGEAAAFDLAHLAGKLRRIEDDKISEKYGPFRKFRHAFLAWCD